MQYVLYTIKINIRIDVQLSPSDILTIYNILVMNWTPGVKHLKFRREDKISFSCDAEQIYDV